MEKKYYLMQTSIVLFFFVCVFPFKLHVRLAQTTHGEQLKESNNSFLTERNKQC